MKRLALFAALLLCAPLAAQDEPVTPASVVASAAPEEWLAIAPEDMLFMDLAPAPDGSERRVVIQLLPPPFSQPWVENIRTLARAHWWDGTSVYRVVDNWVAQWGDVSEEKALPEGVVSPVADYATPADPGDTPVDGLGRVIQRGRWADHEAPPAPPPADWQADLYAPQVGFAAGWPAAAGRMTLPVDCSTADRSQACSEFSRMVDHYRVWPIHCYAHVGVARSLAPDTGTGAELYAVIGHAPRQLDRNIAVVGRVIDGIEHLSTLPRGSGDAGVYESREEDTPILSVRLASELPDPPAYEYLDTDSESFARYAAVRANRQDEFYTVPAGGVDICNVQVPVRAVEE